LVVLIAGTGCVSTGKYDEALAESQRLRQELGSEARTSEARRVELARVTRQLAVAQTKSLDLEQRLAAAIDTSRGNQRQLDDATAMNASLRTELERLGKDVDKLLADRGTLGTALEDARRRLDELRRAQAASESRAALFRSLALKLKRMIDAGELRILLRDGRMALQLSNDVLFDSGKSRIKTTGRQALEQIAAVLTSISDREFQVAGHTDNQPIRVSGYASNWELSTARALEVVKLMIGLGMDPGKVSAAGYSEFDPIADNSSEDGRARNRRIEITLVPNIDEIVAVP
jgi:chemotaxis protein MotB